VWRLLLADFVAKLDEKSLARNNRILAHKVLNQHCALAPALESILLVLAQKIVLQHNRPQGDIAPQL
jgi:DNA repair protein RadC